MAEKGVFGIVGFCEWLCERTTIHKMSVVRVVGGGCEAKNSLRDEPVRITSSSKSDHSDSSLSEDLPVTSSNFPSLHFPCM